MVLVYPFVPCSLDASLQSESVAYVKSQHLGNVKYDIQTNHLIFISLRLKRVCATNSIHSVFVIFWS